MNITLPIWWFILLILSLIVIIVPIVQFHLKSNPEHKKVVVWMVLCLSSIVFLISTVSLYTPRYWLGFFTGILFLFLYTLLHAGLMKNGFKALTYVTVIYCVGLFSVPDMRRDWYYVSVNEIDALNELYEEVKAREIKAVFITDPVIQWKWNYLFGKSIPGTFFSYTERTNEFRDLAFNTLNENSENTAIVGLYGNYLELDKLDSFKSEIDQVAIKYFIMDKVYKDLIYETVARVQ